MAEAYERARTVDGLPASWELIYMAAFAGERAAQALPVGEQRIAVDSITRRQRP